jgi:hypothetical protein
LARMEWIQTTWRASWRRRRPSLRKSIASSKTLYASCVSMERNWEWIEWELRLSVLYTSIYWFFIIIIIIIFFLSNL